ncbi:MAG TPA: response regulator transcription factor [Nitrospirota bacterium]|nr:response regulator transcription factor [Nitrospirota bacterium]
MGIKILLADDHKLIREGLRALIKEQPDMTVVAEAEDGRTAVQLATKFSPNIIIMDISMPGLNGIEATRQILASSANSKVIALSMHIDRRMILEILNAGASGYLLKDCAFDEVIHAIQMVTSNCTYLSPKITDVVVKDYVSRISKEELSTLSILTSREREVLQLLAEGKKTKDIASVLQVSIKTAEFHRQQIMEKLNIHSIAELTKFAIREGLTEL